ncbi:MAG: tRNA pseudouridine(13) synthase TruD [Phycisphaeraceae bacterium]|nr:MAG: tRNA pseudouridine(13) synthase TruD [Phycisphaeraceae bacterium]
MTPAEGPATPPPDARDPRVIPARYLTADIPGTGGRIKQRPEDFLVDEVPLYEPAGTGEHIYLLVEKRNLATFEMLDVIARHFGVRRDAVGHAGLKDRVAITRQVVSVHTPGKVPEDFPSLRHERLAVLWTDLHANKLRVGHLRGNRFSIRVRGVEPAAVLHARRVLDRLARTGVPNRFGEQRFGAALTNHLVGRAVLLADWDAAARELLGPGDLAPDIHREARACFEAGDLAGAMGLYPSVCRAERAVLRVLLRGGSAERAFRSLDAASVRFFLSAFQSAVFNRVLDARIEAGSLASLAPGDLAMKLDNRAVFAVDEAVASDPGTADRLARLEISPTGPLWGPSMMRAAGITDLAEAVALDATGLTPEALSAFGDAHPGLIEGERRPLRVPLIDPDAEGGLDEHGPYVRVAFELPRGAYATTVLKEIIKPASPGAMGQAED